MNEGDGRGVVLGDIKHGRESVSMKGAEHGKEDNYKVSIIIIKTRKEGG